MPSAFRRLSLAGLLCALALPLPAAHVPDAGLPPDDALLLLKDGNLRFAAGTAIHFQQDAQRRHETAANGQRPFAVILACADSRVPPELLFDQGLGCLFVIRVAGNVAQNDEVASIEYGVGHLGVRLIVVLGHTGCGAVTAVVDEVPVGANLAQLAKPIAVATARARKENPGASTAPLVAAAIQANVEQAMADLQRLSPDLAGAIAHGQARLIGALYDLESGEVKFLEEAPAPGAPAASPHDSAATAKPVSAVLPPPPTPAAHH